MWLINTETFELELVFDQPRHQLRGQQGRDYAILSHT